MNDETLEKYVEAGKLTAAAREFGASHAKVGMTLLELAEKIEDFIHKSGGDPAWPVNLSLNEVAAHYTPTYNDATKIKDGDVLKIDCGVHLDGFLGDTAITVQFGAHDRLVKASKDALEAAINLIKPGIKISDLSTVIEDTIRSHGLVPVSNLTGHGVGRYVVHMEPSIPNIRYSSPKTLIENQIIAIEPFASGGAGHVNDAADIQIFGYETERPLRNPDAKRILDYARARQLPFAERWLLKEEAQGFGVPNSLFKVRMALRELLQTGALSGYPPLVDAKKGLVSQHEHTIIVRDDPIIITR